MRRRTKARAWKGVNSIEGKENEKKKMCAEYHIKSQKENSSRNGGGAGRGRT